MNKYVEITEIFEEDAWYTDREQWVGLVGVISKAEPCSSNSAFTFCLFTPKDTEKPSNIFWGIKFKELDRQAT